MLITPPTSYAPPVQIESIHGSTAPYEFKGFEYEFEGLIKDYASPSSVLKRKTSSNKLDSMENLQANFSWENELTTQIDYKQTSLPAYYPENFERLSNSFSKELFKYNYYLPVPENEAKIIFKKKASFISELPFEKGTVELTPSGSISFTLRFSKDRLLIISIPLHNIEDLTEDEIIFSFFVDRQLIISNAAAISTFVEEFKEFLDI